VRTPLQLSEAVAVPSAASIAADVGLHPIFVAVEVGIITGFVISNVHVAVLDAVPTFPHASVTVHVLV
jgi:hypothetical protein